MSEYKNKANRNIKTAEFLLNNGLLLSSAHPAYYSSFLLIKYLLANHFSVSYSQQEILTKNKDSHNILSNLALRKIAEQDAELGRDCLRWYNKLKMMRNKADYKPIEIKDSLLRENWSVANAFMKSVDSHFLSVEK